MKRQRLYAALALLLLAAESGCESDLDSYAQLTRLRILGVRADRPELCVQGPQQCPAGTTSETIEISILAADQSGIVADGKFPDGPFLRDGYTLTWALCNLALRGARTENPDCTAYEDELLPDIAPQIDVNTGEIAPAAAEETSDESTQTIGAAIRNGDQREWAIKRITLSSRPATEQNINPDIDRITLDGITLVPGDVPCAEVLAGHSYRVNWHIPEDSWQEFEVQYPDRVEWKRELYNLAFFATAGTFSDDDQPLELWMGGDQELFWQAPQEIPEAGLDVTLAFTLFDTRGGATWTWGKLRVVQSLHPGG